MSQFAGRNEEISDTVISGNVHQYKVGSVLGKGTFGQVVQCFELQTGNPVAIKFQDAKLGENELDMMSRIHHFDPQRYNFVQYCDCFQYGTSSCLVFELLDQSLWDVMDKISRFFLDEIRPIMHQMLVALQALESVGIIHCDIKLDNIMFVNHKDEPLRVKLIDFGSARLASTIKAGMKCQAERLRAPEVILGLEFTEAIDMWSLGLVMASMVLGFNLYIATYEYDLLKLIIGTLGQPPADLLSNAKYTETFFTKDGDVWSFKTPEEYRASGQQMNNEARCLFKNLDEIKKCYRPYNLVENQDLYDFIDLLQKMLKVDPRERITPSEALQHNYITMQHLEKASPYIQRSFQNMQVCTRDQCLDSKSKHTVSDSSNTGLASGGLDTAPVSDHSKNNILSDNDRTVDMAHSHRVSDPTRHNFMSSEQSRVGHTDHCQTGLDCDSITDDLVSKGTYGNVANPQSGSVSDSSKDCFVGFDNGNNKNPSGCDGAVGCDPPSNSVVVSDCCSARGGVDDDPRFQECLSADTRHIAKVEPLKRMFASSYFIFASSLDILSKVFSMFFKHVKNVKNVICKMFRTTFCRNGKSKDDDIVDVTGKCDAPSSSNSCASAFESLNGMTTDCHT